MWIVEAGADGEAAQIGVVATEVEENDIIPDTLGDGIN